MSEVIVITSGKGGVGKTTTTANIGTGLAQLNKKVVMIDTDIGLRNLDVVMGLENRIVYNLVDVVEGKCRIRQALIKDKKYPDLCLLPSAQTRDKDAVTPEQMVELINELREEFDYILLDCPAGIEQGFKNAVAGADRALVVTTPEVSAIRDADRIVGLLEANEMKRIDLIVNRLRVDMVKRGDMMNVDDVTEILAVNLIGAVPDDENIVISTNQGEPCVGDSSLAGQAFIGIAPLFCLFQCLRLRVGGQCQKIVIIGQQKCVAGFDPVHHIPAEQLLRQFLLVGDADGFHLEPRRQQLRRRTCLGALVGIAAQSKFRLATQRLRQLFHRLRVPDDPRAQLGHVHGPGHPTAHAVAPVIRPQLKPEGRPGGPVLSGAFHAEPQVVLVRPPAVEPPGVPVDPGDTAHHGVILPLFGQKFIDLRSQVLHGAVKLA